ncbi:hypothetical protein [uncultured Abyssibacter sp.]|uniref:hypothetical protein n=1 Tax=uncultured Abyssibacter sp. TaxID=2320202 RepID=UPI0032B2AB51
MTETTDPLAERRFSYETAKNGSVFISFHGRRVTQLAGKDATKFLARVESLDARGQQLLMAKATGNFKRGNERLGKR